MANITVAYIFERYPVLTQTFLRRELAGLSRTGLRLEAHSMMPPVKAGSDTKIPELPEDIPVNHFYWPQAVRFLIALPLELLRDPKLLRDGWRLWRKHSFANRENFWATIWAVIFAVCQARNFRRLKPDLLHGVRATGPATAAAILSRLCGIPFSMGAHAYDVYRNGGDAFLEPKLCAARFVHTTTEATEKYLRERVHGSQIKIVLARRGLESLPEKITRGECYRPIALLSVGRLVAKKGHQHQIAACVLLKSWEIPFVAQIIGDGPLREELRRAINEAGLKNCVTLCGAFLPDEMERAYRWADIFWHTGIVDADGDRDGLPNVIPEAFAHSLPVIVSNLPANKEAVEDGTNGLVVNLKEVKDLAGAVKRLAEDAALRDRLGQNGRQWVEEHFLISRNAEILARAFEEAASKINH